MLANNSKKIFFFSRDCAFVPKQKTALRLWLHMCAKREKVNISELNYIFCSDKYLRKLNKKYLDHNSFTDVITFPYSNPPEISGDIFISIDRVRENANTYLASTYEELYRVMVHGLLHMAGYGDKSESEQKSMRKLEDKYLDLKKQL